MNLGKRIIDFIIYGVRQTDNLENVILKIRDEFGRRTGIHFNMSAILNNLYYNGNKLENIYTGPKVEYDIVLDLLSGRVSMYGIPTDGTASLVLKP